MLSTYAAQTKVILQTNRGAQNFYRCSIELAAEANAIILAKPKNCFKDPIYKKAVSVLCTRWQAQHSTLAKDQEKVLVINNPAGNKLAADLSTQTRLFSFMRRWVDAQKSTTRLVYEGTQPYYHVKGYWKKPLMSD